MACNNYQKSTLTASGYSQTLGSNTVASFLTSSQVTGSSIAMSTDNQTINLKSAGLYQVSVYATATGAADATAVSLQIMRNGIALTTGLASFTPATAEGNAESMGVSTVVKVDKVCGSSGVSAIPIQIKNIGGEATYTMIIVEVIKLA